MDAILRRFAITLNMDLLCEGDSVQAWHVNEVSRRRLDAREGSRLVV
jgi:hypothetical protein